jgi:hypothetical protein
LFGSFIIAENGLNEGFGSVQRLFGSFIIAENGSNEGFGSVQRCFKMLSFALPAPRHKQQLSSVRFY